MGFEEVLDTKLGDAEAPPPFPVGNYLWKIGTPSFGEAKNENQTPYVRYMLRCVEPREGVDMEKFSMVKEPEKREIRQDFWLTEDAVHRLRDFVEKSGAPVNDEMSIRECIPLAGDLHILGYITQTKSKKPGDDTVYSNFSSFAKDE